MLIAEGARALRASPEREGLAELPAVPMEVAPMLPMSVVTGTDKQVNARAPATIIVSRTVAPTVTPPPVAMAVAAPMHFLRRRTGRCSRLEHIQAGGRRVGRSCRESGKAEGHHGKGDR